MSRQLSPHMAKETAMRRTQRLPYATMKTHLPPVPWELRVKVSELLEQGKAPTAVASALQIQEITVHQVIANREHAQAKRNAHAHQVATAKLVDQIERLGAADAGHRDGKSQSLR